ncbi:MerR family DNA-binding transcriptional regulator [Micromonospora sp. NBC_01699]|uniref:MerR family DNA-binding transcriptional regulator n=1 Tax=Micromonospora sp. NBC_01699 TaxID=2975984 RepID=UPI002E2A2006|nr:MerR family DNA-binding transcriptional regulator [Micromonospora sp. NBC_01699]
MSESSPSERGHVRIGELSRRTDVHERLLRYYEQQELLRPTRCPSGYREYSDSHRRRTRRRRRPRPHQPRRPISPRRTAGR